MKQPTATVAERPEVPPRILAEVRSICAAFPDAYEERAWVGVRWRVRGRTFVHVLAMADGWPPAYASAAGTEDLVTAMTFRSSGEELEVLTAIGRPYFRPRWGTDVVGMVLEEPVDWDEVRELLTESYLIRAPKTLAARVAVPAAP